MLHTVLPVLTETGMEQFVFFRVDLINDVTGIAHGDLLIPAFVTSALLPLEGIKLGNGDGHFRQRHTDGGVAHVLVHTHAGVNAHANTREISTPRY